MLSLESRKLWYTNTLKHFHAGGITCLPGISYLLARGTCLPCKSFKRFPLMGDLVELIHPWRIFIAFVLRLTCSIEGPSTSSLRASTLLLILSRRSRSCRDLFTWNKGSALTTTEKQLHILKSVLPQVFRLTDLLEREEWYINSIRNYLVLKLDALIPSIATLMNWFHCMR